MRRGSVMSYVDDSRRHSVGMVLPEFRRSSSINDGRQESVVNDGGDEPIGGCFLSYRKICFAFVFFLALLIAAAFIGVYIGMPPEKDVQDALAILSKDEDAPENYALAPSVKPLSYLVELGPVTPVIEGGARLARLQGRCTIEFEQRGGQGPSQLVLNLKHLRIKSYRLLVLAGGGGNVTAGAAGDKQRLQQESEGRRRRRREAAEDEAKNETELTKDENESPAVHSTESKAEVVVTGNKTDTDSSVYVLFLEKPLMNGTYSVDIQYEATVTERVLFLKNFTKNSENKTLLVSQLKPANAPRLFPTLDEAKLKANFILKLSHPRGTKVLSNSPSVEFNDTGVEDLWTVDKFAKTRPMSAHNLAFVVGDLEALEPDATSQERNVTYWADPQLKSAKSYLRDKVAPIIKAYEELFREIALPTDKLDVAALPVEFKGLSAPGLIVVRESHFYATADSPLPTRATALLNLIGLIGQQWLGGLVNARNWTDAWFIEGSILYFQHTLLYKIDYELNTSADFLIDVQIEAMENDGYVISKALDSKVDRHRMEIFDLTDNYRKGACLISMLHAVLSESTFRSGYTDFLRRWGYKTTDSDEFLRIIAGNAMIDAKSDAAMRLDEAFATWTRQPGYPMINVTWFRENGTVLITQAKFNFDETPDEEDEEEELLQQQGLAAKRPEDETLWWLPLTFVTAARADWSAPAMAWLKGEKEMRLGGIGRPEDGVDWIVFNVDRNGYYRVNYDEATWATLGAALHELPEAFPVTTRASLIDDALSLARQGSLAYEAAFELLGYLGPRERDCAPWRALARHAMQLDFALYETPAYAEFQEFMRKLVSTLYEEVEPRMDDGSPLMVLAVQLACRFEYQKCTTWAKKKWEGLFKNKVENTIPALLRETVYCVGARRGSQEELTYLMQKFDTASDEDEKDRVLSALGCFQSPWILQKVLNELLETQKYEGSEVKMILRSYGKNPAAAQAARRFIQVNWKEIVKRFSNSYWTMKAFVEASTSLLFTEHDIKEFNEFRDENIDSLKSLKGMGHWVALNEMKASSWIYRLKESSGSIQRWLKNYTAPVA